MPTTITGTSGTSQISDGTVTTSKVVDGAITPVKVSGFVITQSNQYPLPAQGVLLSFSHGLGVVPVGAELELVCTVADGGYSVGDIINPLTSGNPSFSHPFTIFRDTGVVSARTGSSVSFGAQNKSTGTTFNLTLTSWAWRFKVRAA